ncbi:MAG: hypothetical protein LQ341_007409, partial [Variospora aurantia]
RNLAAAAKKASTTSLPLSHFAALCAIERALHALSPSEDGNIFYVSEGANTTDISRFIFPVAYRDFVSMRVHTRPWA